jgi:hypothetical protein
MEAAGGGRSLEAVGRLCGWHADMASFMKERSVSFIGEDEINDVIPTTLPLVGMASGDCRLDIDRSTLYAASAPL